MNIKHRCGLKLTYLKNPVRILNNKQNCDNKMVDTHSTCTHESVHERSIHFTVEEGNQRKKIMWKEAMWARN